MRVQLRFQAAFNHRFGQFFEQPTLAQDVLGGLLRFEQFVNQFASNGHAGFLSGE